MIVGPNEAQQLLTDRGMIDAVAALVTRLY